MNMNKLRHLSLVGLLFIVACAATPTEADNGTSEEVVYDANTLVVVNDVVLTRDDLLRDMPKGWTGEDSLTFAKMYVDNWVLKQLKIERATTVLPSYEDYIDRLVEDYRQSLIMRQLDQYYVDNDIDHDVTEQQIVSYYRANSAQFKLNHHIVKGIIIKVPKNFKNTKSLTTALDAARKTKDVSEVMALAEKLSLDVTDKSAKWESYNDFLGYLPTVRTKNYDYLLSKTTAQNMSSDDAIFYFIFIDVARKGTTSPLEVVMDDIKRLLYAERRAEIINSYEYDLRRDAMSDNRITFYDDDLERLMDYQKRLEIVGELDEEPEIVVETIEEGEIDNE